MFVRIENLTYWYRSPFFPERRALYLVNMEIQPKEIVAIVGGTGSGKTTLIRHFNGLLKPTEGIVRIDSRDLSTIKLEAVKKKDRIGFSIPGESAF